MIIWKCSYTEDVGAWRKHSVCQNCNLFLFGLLRFSCRRFGTHYWFHLHIFIIFLSFRGYPNARKVFSSGDFMSCYTQCHIQTTFWIRKSTVVFAGYKATRQCICDTKQQAASKQQTSLQSYIIERKFNSICCAFLAITHATSLSLLFRHFPIAISDCTCRCWLMIPRVVCANKPDCLLWLLIHYRSLAGQLHSHELESIIHSLFPSVRPHASEPLS